MRKHNYVVGFRGEGQCIYGGKTRSTEEYTDYVNLLTLFQARQKLRKFPIIKDLKIYKLVEVKNVDSK